MSGTSMAAPAVAGVAAQLVQKNPLLTVADYTAALDKADREGTAPLDSPSSSYTFDGIREGIVHAPTALAP
jgi:subtilisin family serine protease